MKPIIEAIGNLTKKPTLEYTRTNKVPTVAFTVACNGIQDGDTTFLYCRAYKKTAENIAEYCDKGSRIFVVGELSQYTDEKKNSHTFCDVYKAQFLGGVRREQEPPIRDVDAQERGDNDGNPF